MTATQRPAAPHPTTPAAPHPTTPGAPGATTPPRPWVLVGQVAAALAAGMGIGRFVYTPILPLMHAQAGLSPPRCGRG